MPTSRDGVSTSGGAVPASGDGVPASGGDVSTPRLVLAPRLVPRPLWGRSAARLLDEEAWRAVRDEVVADAGSRCFVCGHHQRRWMVCDEDWRYAIDRDELGQRGRAVLVGLRLLCPRCDRVVHLGHTESRHGRRGADDALRHGAAINGVSVGDMRLLAEGAFEAWARSSSVRRWTVAVDPALAARFPEICVVEGVVAG